MKRFCDDLNELAIQVISYEEKEMITLTQRQEMY